MTAHLSRVGALLIVALLVAVDNAKGQRSSQISNNITFSHDITDTLSLRGEVAFDFMYIDPSYWNETSLFLQYAFRPVRFLEGSLNLRYARTQQNKELGSRELRPSTGFRFFSNSGRRAMISNRSLLEFRWLVYTNDQNDFTIRFRNRTTALFSMLKTSVSDTDNLILYTFFEAFHNTESGTVERFFQRTNWKLGLSYRFSNLWLFDVGFNYFDAKNNTEDTSAQPSQLPTVIDSNTSVEWRMVFVF